MLNGCEPDGKALWVLCSQLDYPRRIQLRQGRFLEAYRLREADDDIIEIGHNLTKLRRVDDLDMADALTVFQQPLMHPIEYAQDREYPLRSSIRLPEPAIPDRPFSELVRGRRSRRNFGQRPLALSELSALLFGAIGETGRLTASFEDDRPVEVSLRSIPSGGALHPTRIFTVVLQPGELAPGVYHYDVPEHSIEFVKPLPARKSTRFSRPFQFIRRWWISRKWRGFFLSPPSSGGRESNTARVGIGTACRRLDVRAKTLA